jgi:L-2,4-diaminobutyrate decarboxylase
MKATFQPVHEMSSPSPAPPQPEPPVTGAARLEDLAGSAQGLRRLPELLATALSAAQTSQRHLGPAPVGTTSAVLGAVAEALGSSELPRHGVGELEALRRLARVMFDQGLDLSHPHAAAHLQAPPLTVAVAADALASASNASLDTYDSGPSAIGVERWLVTALARLAGLSENAGGVLTPGGSISNLLGLLLARDAAALRLRIDARRDGTAALPRPVIFCSELAHFSMHRACAVMGLGEHAVRPISTDAQRRMRVAELERALGALAPDETPIAIVATAGTTDFGSVDPLPELSALARAHGIWLHVDAAYGFGALFSRRLASRLAGLERADSVTLDLHKLGWQPAAASVLLVADPTAFSALEREVAYLNPRDDAEAGLDGLLGRSLQTTRRPDALKIAATVLALGTDGLGGLVDACHDLARHAQRRIEEHAELELVAPAELTTVVFRYLCRRGAAFDPRFEDEVNGALRRHLLERGEALIGRTAVRLGGHSSVERVCLKLTLLNPTAQPADLDQLLDTIVTAGRELERRLEERLA